MRKVPLTNSGITVIDRLETVVTRSRRLSRRSPAKTPRQTAVGTMITSAKPASSSEFAKARMTIGSTGVVNCSESPQWPTTKCPAHWT